MLNQVQPAPYDGMYTFPSVAAKTDPGHRRATCLELDPTTYSTDCTICVTNPVDGTPMLPAGKYVVEVVVPAGYELVKEEDKNILLGDVYIAPGDAAVRRASATSSSCPTRRRSVRTTTPTTRAA